MQVYSNSKGLSNKSLLLLALLLLVAYLPISTFMYFIKNDAFTGYFPPKFFMSESIQAGILPLWNPYINFGIPQYGDMSGGFWNPITWLIAGTVGYNAWSFTIEILLYIFLSGVGMYVLCRHYRFLKPTCIITAASYMCCGYMVGHLQHVNWLSGAAFLPFCFYAYKRLTEKFNFYNIFLAALLFYLLISSSHPGIIIGSIYFFFGYALFVLFQNDSRPFMEKAANLFFSNFFLLSALCLVGLGLLYGYTDIIPHFSRGEKPVETAIVYPFSIAGWVSFILPFSTVKNDALYQTDISMRNAYMGLLLLVFFIVALLRTKTREQWFLLGCVLFFLALASGYGLTKLFYKLPLLGYVRTPGEYRLFTIFPAMIFSSFALNRFLKGKYAHQTIVTHILNLLLLVTGILLVFSLFKILAGADSILSAGTDNSSITGRPARIKWLVDNISFYDCIMLQSLLQFGLLWLMKRFLQARAFKILIYIVCLDLALASLMNIPFTGVGQASVNDIQQILNRSPSGIPLPGHQPIILNDTASSEINNMVGDWSFYNKQPGTTHFVLYPVILNNTDYIFSSNNKLNFKRSFVFAKHSFPAIDIQQYNGQQITFNTNLVVADTIVLQQALYPHWKVNVNDTPAVVLNYNEIYPAVALPAGKSSVKFLFKPEKIRTMFYVSAILFCLLILALVIIPFFPSWQKRRRRP